MKIYSRHIQRVRKLKNREAAQTSRDRKKARMTELELQVRYLQEQNERLRCEKEDVCKENERLKQKLTHPATHQAPGSVTPTTQVEAQRVAPSIERESAEFLELSPQQTAGPMQKVTRLAFPCPSTESSLSQETLVLDEEWDWLLDLEAGTSPVSVQQLEHFTASLLESTPPHNSEGAESSTPVVEHGAPSLASHPLPSHQRAPLSPSPAPTGSYPPTCQTPAISGNPGGRHNEEGAGPVLRKSRPTTLYKRIVPKGVGSCELGLNRVSPAYTVRQYPDRVRPVLPQSYLNIGPAGSVVSVGSSLHIGPCLNISPNLNTIPSNLNLSPNSISSKLKTSPNGSHLGQRPQNASRIQKYVQSNALLVPTTKTRPGGKKLYSPAALPSVDHDYFKVEETRESTCYEDTCVKQREEDVQGGLESEISIEDAVEEVVTSDGECGSPCNMGTSSDMMDPPCTIPSVTHLSDIVDEMTDLLTGCGRNLSSDQSNCTSRNNRNQGDCNENNGNPSNYTGLGNGIVQGISTPNGTNQRSNAAQGNGTNQDSIHISTQGNGANQNTVPTQGNSHAKRPSGRRPSKPSKSRRRQDMITAIVDDIQSFETRHSPVGNGKPDLDALSENSHGNAALFNTKLFNGADTLFSGVQSNSSLLASSLSSLYQPDLVPCPFDIELPDDLALDGDLTLDSGMSTLETNMTSLNRGMSILESNLTLGNDLTTLENGMSTLDSNLTLENDLTTLESGMSRLDSNMTLDSAVSTLIQDDGLVGSSKTSICSEDRGYESVDSPLSDSSIGDLPLSDSSMGDFIMNDSFLFPDLSLEL
ncbi:hypothetical protein M8J76_002455 [Diaphorina citri]|nr:hypothetical protein M8J76_002455 [Diaphorina citri]